MSAVLTVEGLRAGYGARPVLTGLDLTLVDGVTAILGSSGCGKTTLLRAVAGFVEPEAGRITIAGTEVVGDGRSLPARRRGVGYVPQEGALFPHLSVAANIAFGLPRSERRRALAAGGVVTDLLDLLDLPRELAERAPHQLSGGQQQRVAVARALAPKPRLVLLDEPFSSLDAGLREDTGRAVLRAVRATGAAALLVTHDQGEALSLADQVAVMDAGRFLQVAAPRELYLAPVSAGVAAFVGHAVLLDAEVSASAPHRAASELGDLVLAAARPAGPTRLAVRGEQLEVVPGATAGVPGEVVEVSFFGHDASVGVRLAGGTVVIARIAALGVPEVGEQVGVRVVGPVVSFDRDAE